MYLCFIYEVFSLPIYLVKTYKYVFVQDVLVTVNLIGSHLVSRHKSSSTFTQFYWTKRQIHICKLLFITSLIRFEACTIPCEFANRDIVVGTNAGPCLNCHIQARYRPSNEECTQNYPNSNLTRNDVKMSTENLACRRRPINCICPIYTPNKS